MGSISLTLEPSGSLVGLRVVARKTRDGACATVSRVTGRKKTSAGLTSRVKLGNAEDLSLSDLGPGAVIKRIRDKYLAGIKRCHQRTLGGNPKAQGKVAVRFTVGSTGSVAKASVKGFAPTLDSCIRAEMLSWEFSIPRHSGAPTSADFEVPLLLKPGKK